MGASPWHHQLHARPHDPPLCSEAARSLFSRLGKGGDPGIPSGVRAAGVPTKPRQRALCASCKVSAGANVRAAGAGSYRRRPVLGSGRGSAPEVAGRSPPSSRPVLHPREAAQPERRRGAHPPGPRDAPCVSPFSERRRRHGDEGGGGGSGADGSSARAAAPVRTQGARARPRVRPHARRSRQRPGPRSPAAESPRVPRALLSGYGAPGTFFGGGSSIQQANDD